MDRKWAWGIIAALLVTWLVGISTKVMALSEKSAATEAILPRIEQRVNEIYLLLTKH